HLTNKAMARKYVQYQAHIRRNGVVHTSDDEMVTLLGDLSTLPATETKYYLEFPSSLNKEPSFNLRFIPKDKIEVYIRDCKDGALEVPPNLDTYPAPDINLTRKTSKVRLTEDRPGRFKKRFQEYLGISKRRILLDVEQVEIGFTTEAEEWAYVCVVEMEPLREDVSDSFSVVVYNKEKTFFPESDDDDLADLLNCTINISCKNGILWFVHPIYFVEQLLNVTLDPAVKREMVSCKGLPKDLPANDEVLACLQWGYSFRGLKKVRIEVDKEPEDPCVQTDTVQVIKDEDRFEFTDLMNKL
ncbi:MAG: hypothetical protein ACR2MX_15865, partial [Cyclobacteriaceae bacterium]